MASKSLGQLTIDLVARTGGFVQGMDKAERQSKKWRKQVERDMEKVSNGLMAVGKATTAATATGAAALTALTVSSLKSIDAQNKLARSLNTTYDSVTALGFAFDESGVNGYEESLARLNRRLGAAEMGSGEAAQTVDALNLNLEELSGLDADERVARIADAIRDSGASAQEAARYAQQLGFEQKEAAQFFMQGGDAIRAYRQEVEAFGLALDTVDAIKVEQANDAFGRTGLLMDAVGQQMAVQVAPIVSAVSDLFLQSAKDVGGMEEAVEDGFNAIIEAAGFVADAVEGVNRVIDVTGSAVAILGLNVKKILLTIYRDAVELPVEAANQIISALNALPGIDLDLIALPGDDIRQEIALTKGAIEEGWNDIHNTLMAPLPSTMFEQFVDEAREKSDEAARLTEEANERIRSAMGVTVTPKGPMAGTDDSEGAGGSVGSDTGGEDIELSYWDKWMDSAEENLQNFDELSKTVVDNFTTGFGNAFESVIFDAQTLDDALEGIGETILRSVVNSIGQMAAQWLALQAVQAVMGSSATTASIAQAETVGAAWAGPAAMAALATGGANVGPASAALLTTTTLAKGLSLTGMAHDGIDRVPREGTWLLDKDERVLTAPQADNLDAFLASERMRGASTDAPIVNITENPDKAGSVQARQNDNGQWVIDVVVADALNGGRASKTYESVYGMRRQGR
ncbi:hypothetical protein [Marinobacter qingdaonensis]|uniref:Uncharacterized protein n=1 Tax=Marinobacter qingdaonensis TaxID=3108486 RepID=A0ABU5P1Q6_9GAMM|nr:hypothetical protein [Marinobacter sp. ASW11-75]MEA1081970.1 hypothetical protein [Marinobacter sp. ASW11-75]